MGTGIFRQKMAKFDLDIRKDNEISGSPSQGVCLRDYLQSGTIYPPMPAGHHGSEDEF